MLLIHFMIYGDIEFVSNIILIIIMYYYCCCCEVVIKVSQLQQFPKGTFVSVTGR